jgi:threonine synthase
VSERERRERNMLHSSAVASSKPVYESTRGGERGLSFRHVVLKGLADDGGLFVPSHLPRVDRQQLDRWRNLPYASLAFEILSLFIDEDDIPAATLREIIQRSYSAFFVDDVLRVQTCYMGGDDESREQQQQINVCELFHGPTFSFKDFALQFLGHAFEYLLDTNALRKQQRDAASKGEEEAAATEDDPAGVTRITVLGATSGMSVPSKTSPQLSPHHHHSWHPFGTTLTTPHALSCRSLLRFAGPTSGDTGSAGE